MASDLLSIASSGAKVARQSLDLVAQNIAHASTQGYVRRTARLGEVSATGAARIGGAALSGVRLEAVVRNVDQFRTAEVRRTGSDSARAEAQLGALTDIESAIEQSGVYPAITGFTAGLQMLAADPVSNPLRGAVIQDAAAMTRSFNAAAGSLGAVGHGLADAASDGVTQVNTLARELAKLNLRLTRATALGNDRSALLDQRDLMLRQLSSQADLTTTFAPDQSVTVQIGGASGPVLVNGTATTPLNLTTATDGTIGFDLGGAPVALSGGALAGIAQGLTGVRDTRLSLDAIATGLIGTINTAQANGVDLAGTTGQPLLSGTDAATLALAVQNGALIATAPAGAVAMSRNPANLDALNRALTAADPAGATDALLLAISSQTAVARLSGDTLQGLRTAPWRRCRRRPGSISIRRR